MNDEKVDMTQLEEAFEPRQISKCDTDGITLLDTGSTFNSTNNEESLANMINTLQPMVSRTNVGQ